MNTFLRAIGKIEEYTLGLSLLGLALFACVQVFTRYVLNYSFSWFEELSQYFCVFLTFLGASIGLRYSTHFSMTALVDRLPFRARHAIKALVYIIAAIFFAVVAYYGFQHCMKHYRFGNLSAALRLPLYIPYLPIPVFSSIMVCRSLLIVGQSLRAAFRGPGRDDSDD